MKEEERTQGFSFELSASAPPAEVAPANALDDQEAFSSFSTFDFAGEPAGEPALSLGAELEGAGEPLLGPDDETRTPAPAGPAAPVRSPAPAATAAPTAPAAPPGSVATESTQTGTLAPTGSAKAAPAATAPRPEARRSGAPQVLAIKRISFPRGAPTVFSKSVSQAPRVCRLDPSDVDPMCGDADLPLSPVAPPAGAPDAPPPEDLTFPARISPAILRPSSPSPAAMARVVLRRGLDVAADGAQRLARAARPLGVWALTRVKGAFANARGGKQPASETPEGGLPVAPPRDSLPSEEGFLLVEGTPRPTGVAGQGSERLRVVERLRGALPAVSALAAAAACYVLVGQLVAPSQEAETSEAHAAAALDGSALEETALDEAASDNVASDASGEPARAKGKARPSASAKTTGAAAPPATASLSGSSADGSVTREQLALPDGLGWPGKGLIEVVTPGRELIYVDGVFTGRGPLRRIPVSPGSHEVVLRTETSERRTTVDVLVDRRSRLVFGEGNAKK